MTSVHLSPHSPLQAIDVELIGAAAAREARNREAAIPPVSVFRWWARRTESVFGSILDAFASGNGSDFLVADPFCGGGTIALAALRRGHSVYAQDINSWATRGLELMFTLPSVENITNVANALHLRLASQLRAAYRTRMADGSIGEVAHTIRVINSRCPDCGVSSRLFPHTLVSLKQRKDRGSGGAFMACPVGHLWESARISPQPCPECSRPTDPDTRYLPRRMITCAHCLAVQSLSARLSLQSHNWEVVLVERCVDRTRELGIPTLEDLEVADQFGDYRVGTRLDIIPDGAESTVLRRHGYRYWSDLFPGRQLALTEHIFEHINELDIDPHERELLTFATINSTEMAGYLSRWDRWYLKPYEAMAGHRFNITTLAAEPHVWGVEASGRGNLSRRLRQLKRASQWLQDHLDRTPKIRVNGSRLPLNQYGGDSELQVVTGDSSHLSLSTDSVNLVLTDPPYYDDIHYADLSNFFRSWYETQTHIEDELLPIPGRDAEYRDHLERVFKEMARVLRSDGHLVLSFANRNPRAWSRLFRSLQDARFHPAGFAILHAENETDQTKRGRRSCVLDLIMHLTLQPCTQANPRLKVTEVHSSDESHFLGLAASYFQRIGALTGSWEQDLEKALADHPFLSSRVES